MNSALQVYQSTPLEGIKALGIAFAKSGFSGCEREEQGQFLAWVCFSEGITPTQFIRTYDIIGGKLRKKAMAAFAEFRQRGGKVRWIKTGEDGQTASAEFEFEGNKIELSFTIEQARKMEVIRKGSNWEKSPANMLRARLCSNAVGMLCPEIFAGTEADDETELPAAKELVLAPTNLGATQGQLRDSALQTEPNFGAEPITPKVVTPLVDVKSEVVTDEKAEAAAGLAPIAAAPAAPAQYVPPTVDDSIVDQVLAALKGNEDKALIWMISARGAYLTPETILAGLTEGQQRELELKLDPGASPAEKAKVYIEMGAFKREWIAALTPIRARRIINQRESFVRAIGGVL